MDNQHKLSIRLLPGGFCFSSIQEGTDSEPQMVNITPRADYEERLENAILDIGIDAGENDIECHIETSRFAMSPSEYDEELAEKLFNLSLRRVDKGELILHELNNSGDIRISFGIDMSLYNFLKRTFQYINFHHPIMELINEEATKIHSGDSWMTVKTNKDSIDILVYKGHELQLANRFETSVSSNRAYYLLNTWQQQNLDVLHDTLYIIGEENEASKLKVSVSKFIKLCV